MSQISNNTVRNKASADQDWPMVIAAELWHHRFTGFSTVCGWISPLATGSSSIHSPWIDMLKKQQTAHTGRDGETIYKQSAPACGSAAQASIRPASLLCTMWLASNPFLKGCLASYCCCFFLLLDSLMSDYRIATCSNPSHVGHGFMPLQRLLNRDWNIC